MYEAVDQLFLNVRRRLRELANPLGRQTRSERGMLLVPHQAIQPCYVLAPLAQVWFNQQPSPRISRLGLRGPDGRDVELGKVEVHSEDRSISAAVPAALPPGTYEATWRAAGDDGHVMRGAFTFTIVPAK